MNADSVEETPYADQEQQAPYDYPPARWRLIVSGYADGATNMAVDEAILRAVAEKHAPPTLRFYGWQPACVSIGYAQPLVAEIDLERCQRDGVDWVRRPTGGRAILHVDELTYSVVAPQDDPRTAGGVVESYCRLSRGLCAGLTALNLDVAQANYQRQAERRQKLSAACFDLPSHYEVTVAGRKLVGSAQTRRLGVILQHGTLPLVGDITRLIDYLKLEDEDQRAAMQRKLRRRAATLEEVLGRPISWDEAVRAMVAGFAEALRLELEPAELTEQERFWVGEIRADRYASAAWNGLR
jgi:lipoyl(octanoyl) transferase